ncbi:hypothetical protein CNMCM5793_000315 [Aspergillus hiratsukae]|uniref:Uncharacterized protein n=1 Tax=Aspergillus hiratsukae TaxID=1194566 RepID=A0A8H6P0W1_9EURO|nr:hypothetical protein CNMCM5793_000315 [Aspergillus hiratsukae]KAF7163280.1 hypothetical protein CNMCM6106_000228 [Aspergillus hiratsukae]
MTHSIGGPSGGTDYHHSMITAAHSPHPKDMTSSVPGHPLAEPAKGKAAVTSNETPNTKRTFQSYYKTTLLAEYSPSTISWIPSLQAFAVVFEFASGGYVSLPPALVVGISLLEEIGYGTGLLFLFSSVGGLTVSPIGGAIFQRDGGSYTGMKVFSGVMLLVGTDFVMAARVVQTGWVVKAKF